MTLYQKIGRRYKPVADTCARDGLGNGSWLVTVEDGLTKIRRAVDDGHGLDLVAAGHRWLSEWLSKALMESGAYSWGRGSSSPLSAKEIKAVAAYRAIAGANCEIWMTKPAAADVADKVVTKLMEKVKGCEK